MSERKRIVQTAEAAALLGITTSRLRSMPGECGWWDDALRTSEGFDVVGIAIAQTRAEAARKVGISTTTTTASEEKIEAANVTIAVESAASKTLDRRAKERKDLREENEVVLTEVVKRCLSEAFRGLLKELQDLPFVFSQQVPGEFGDLVYIAGSRLESEDSEVDPALLQELVQDVIEGYGQLLDMAASEIFDDDDE